MSYRPRDTLLIILTFNEHQIILMYCTFLLSSAMLFFLLLVVITSQNTLDSAMPSGIESYLL